MNYGRIHVLEIGVKIIPMEKKCKKAKWLSEEALQIAVIRREVKRRKRKILPFECRVPKNSKARFKKSLPQQSMQRNREKQ